MSNKVDGSASHGVASYMRTLPLYAPTTSALEIHGSVRIEQNGTVHLAPGVTLDEASDQFWHKIAAALPGLFVSRETYSQATSRLSEMEGEIKRLREALRLIADRPTNIPIDPHGMAQFARAALEHQQKGEKL